MRTLSESVEVLKRHDADAELAFQEVYEQTRRVALAVIRRYNSKTAEYEDILQETYIKVYRNIDSLNDSSKIQAWVNRIAANIAIRHNQKENPLMFSEMENEEGQMPDFEDESVESNPELVADRKAVVQIVNQILDGLPADQKAALLMVYGQKVTIREMAEELGVSENTIKSRLYQGRQKLMAKKDDFRKMGIELTSAAIVAVITMSFEDTVYAASLATGAAATGAVVGSSAAMGGTSAGSAAGTGGAGSVVGGANAAGGISAAGGTVAAGTAGVAKAAGTAATVTAAKAAGVGSMAAKAAAVIGQMTIGAKLAVAGVAAAAVVGTTAVVGGGSDIIGGESRGASPDMEPIEERMEAYNNRRYSMQEQYDVFYPDYILEKIDTLAESADASEYPLSNWNDSSVTTREFSIDLDEYNRTYGEDWKISWKKISEEKVDEKKLESIRKMYSKLLNVHPALLLSDVFRKHPEERDEIEGWAEGQEVKEARKITVKLTIQGSKGRGEREAEAIVVHYGGNWLLYPDRPEDLVYWIEFHKVDDDSSERADAGSRTDSDSVETEDDFLSRISLSADRHEADSDEIGEIDSAEQEENTSFLSGQETEVLFSSSTYDNEENRSAAKAYQEILKTDSDFTAEDLDIVGVWMIDPDQDGKLEAAIPIRYKGGAITKIYFLQYDGDVQKDVLECQIYLADVAVIPGENKFLMSAVEGWDDDWGANVWTYDGQRISDEGVYVCYGGSYAGPVDPSDAEARDYLKRAVYLKPVTYDEAVRNIGVLERPSSPYEGPYSVQNQLPDFVPAVEAPLATALPKKIYDNEMNRAAAAAYREFLLEQAAPDETRIRHIYVTDVDQNGVVELRFERYEGMSSSQFYELFYDGKLSAENTEDFDGGARYRICHAVIPGRREEVTMRYRFKNDEEGNDACYFECSSYILKEKKYVWQEDYYWKDAASACEIFDADMFALGNERMKEALVLDEIPLDRVKASEESLLYPSPSLGIASEVYQVNQG